jgi:hypothetical protein
LPLICADAADKPQPLKHGGSGGGRESEIHGQPGTDPMIGGSELPNLVPEEVQKICEKKQDFQSTLSH